MHKKLIRHEVIIYALPTKVWKVITCTEYARQFFFNEALQSDWMKGSPIVLEVENNGTKASLTKGMVQEVVPGISLQFTLYELPQFSDCPLVCQYELIPEEGGIRLILSQEILLHAHHLYNLMSETCEMMLQKIKWLAEYS